MSSQVLVVYLSRYGQTEKIARRIAEVVQGMGIAAKALPIGPEAERALRESSDVILAGAVYFGHHRRELVRFVRRELPELITRHTAFVSVCNVVAEPANAHKAAAFLDEFARATGWMPDTTISFGGAMTYSRYNWLLRILMRAIARSRGADATKDSELTDWSAVDAFGRDFVAVARSRVA